MKCIVFVPFGCLVCFCLLVLLVVRFKSDSHECLSWWTYSRKNALTWIFFFFFFHFLTDCEIDSSCLQQLGFAV